MSSPPSAISIDPTTRDMVALSLGRSGHHQGAVASRKATASFSLRYRSGTHRPKERCPDERIRGNNCL